MHALNLIHFSSGETSDIYILKDDRKHVFKINKNLSQHKKEVDYYLKCSKNTTPLICQHEISNKKGYMQLEKVTTFKLNQKNFDLEKMLSTKHQYDLLFVFDSFTSMNFIHMDSHIGNIGINHQNKAVVFDFEYAQQRVWCNDFEKKCATMFSLFLLLDFVQVKQIQECFIWNFAIKTLGQEIFSWCEEKIQEKELTKKIFLNKAKNLTTSNNFDIVFACLASIVVLKTDLSARFDLQLYLYITSVQQNKFVS